jgi:predicted ArsR family transcriptional regulator
MLSVLRAAEQPQTVAQIAQAVGLSLATTRFHLTHLVDEGLVISRIRADQHRQGPGRPSLLFRALPAEAVDPGAAYRQLATVLADQVSATGATASALAAGERWATQLTAQQVAARPRSGAASQSGRLPRLLRMLADGGFAPQATSDGTGIHLHACPYMDLARTHADVVCSVHLGLIRGLLRHPASGTGADVGIDTGTEVQVLPVLDGSGPCLVTLPAERSS